MPEPPPPPPEGPISRSGGKSAGLVRPGLAARRAAPAGSRGRAARAAPYRTRRKARSSSGRCVRDPVAARHLPETLKRWSMYSPGRPLPRIARPSWPGTAVLRAFPSRQERPDAAPQNPAGILARDAAAHRLGGRRAVRRAERAAERLEEPALLALWRGSPAGRRSPAPNRARATAGATADGTPEPRRPASPQERR